MQCDAFIKEGSDFKLKLTFRDSDGNLAAPSNVIYQIDCLTNRVIVIDDVDIPNPTSEMVVQLVPESTEVIDQKNRTESRRIIFTSTASDGFRTVETYNYILQNTAIQ